MENKAVPKRVVCFDALNVLACLSVIAMHCNGAVHVFADTYVWRQSLLVDVLAYWAVPVFIMLSGATLMRYRERYTTKEFLRRRFLKTGIPLVVWTAVFYVYYRAEGTITWDRLARVAQQPDKLYDCAGVLVFFAVVSGLSFAAGAVAAFG